MHSVNISGSELQQTVQALFREFMTASLKEKPEIAEKRTLNDVLLCFTLSLIPRSSNPRFLRFLPSSDPRTGVPESTVP